MGLCVCMCVYNNPIYIYYVYGLAQHNIHLMSVDICIELCFILIVITWWLRVVSVADALCLNYPYKIQFIVAITSYLQVYACTCVCLSVSVYRMRLLPEATHCALRRSSQTKTQEP